MASPKGPSRSRPAGRRKRPGAKKNQAGQGSSFFKAVLGLFLLVLIVVAAALVIRHFFPPEADKKGKARYEVYTGRDSGSGGKHGQNVTSYKNESDDEHDVETGRDSVTEDVDDDGGGKDTPPPDRDVDRDKLPVAALIIDDIGYDRGMARSLAEIDPGITFSILPHSPHRREIAAYARKKGLEVMLHLPMEPMEYPQVDPGPGALLMAQDPDTLIETLKDNLESVPDIMGVNNHMGSRMTSESTKMYQVFTVLKKKNLFFIDSRTAPRSVCRPSAGLLQIPFAERDVFLDHSQDRETIRKQIRTLVRTAERKGRAIGIGHPHAETYEMLVEEYPRLSRRVRIVHASELVRPAG